MDHEGLRRVEGSMMIDPAALTMDINPPHGGKYWLEDRMLPTGRVGQIKPTFRIGELAKIFFARSADWMRMQGHKREGEDAESAMDVARTGAGSRVYTLVDAERIAHDLLEHNRISVQRFVAAINMIRWMAYNYGILSDAEMMGKAAPPRVAQKQAPIPGVDAEIRRAGGCEPCQQGQHQDCDTAAEVAQAAWQGGSVAIESGCTCYASDPGKHE